MNVVEARQVLSYKELNNLTSMNADFNVTTEFPLTTLDPMTTVIPGKETVIGTMVKTALALQNVTTTDETNINHPFYIYIWAIGILGCIILTTGRLVTISSFTLAYSFFKLRFLINTIPTSKPGYKTFLCPGISR